MRLKELLPIGKIDELRKGKKYATTNVKQAAAGITYKLITAGDGMGPYRNEAEIFRLFADVQAGKLDKNQFYTLIDDLIGDAWGDGYEDNKNTYNFGY